MAKISAAQPEDRAVLREESETLSNGALREAGEVEIIVDPEAEPAQPDRPKAASVDESGVPRNRLASTWWDVLAEKKAASGQSVATGCDGLRALADAAARFTRPDGSMVFGPRGARPDRVLGMKRLAESLGEPGLATLAWWWSGRPKGESAFAPPPMPAFGHPTRALAVLRENWAIDGDLLAIDARDPARTEVEVMVGGRVLIGPEWPSASGASRLDSWTTTSTADCVEWSFGIGASRVSRMLVLLRGRGLAIVAEESPGTTSAEMRIGLAPGVATKTVAGSLALVSKPIGASRGASLVPFSLAESGGGSLVASDDWITLTAPAPVAGGRCWLPLLVSWHESRARKATHWRTLTVSEDSRACTPDVAFAARIAWGMGESLVVYRSLARPARRSFLGHQTSARFLVGIFSEAGDVRPLLSLD